MVDDIVRYPAKAGSGLTNHATYALEDRINTLLTKDTNKVKVYTQGFDGHSLRTYNYYPHIKEQVRQAEEGSKAYKVKVGSTDICFLGTDTIEYQGTKYTGDELYEKITCKGF